MPIDIRKLALESRPKGFTATISKMRADEIVRLKAELARDRQRHDVSMAFMRQELNDAHVEIKRLRAERAEAAECALSLHAILEGQHQ